MKTLIIRTWEKPGGKALLAALYSAASILLYFAVAQLAYFCFGSTLLPAIGRPVQAAVPNPVEDARLQSLFGTSHLYDGPGSPDYASKHPTPESNAATAPTQIH